MSGWVLLVLLPIGAGLVLAVVVVLTVRGDRRAAALYRSERDLARPARLDTYLPQRDDRFWVDWSGHRHGGVL